MHSSTFQYLKPSEAQIQEMGVLREAFHDLFKLLNDKTPDSRYKELAISALEESAMWVNKGLTRNGDGSPRPGAKV